MHRDRKVSNPIANQSMVIMDEGRGGCGRSERQKNERLSNEILNETRQAMCAYGVTSGRVRVATVVVEKQ
jgi:hypothetical protein